MLSTRLATGNCRVNKRNMVLGMLELTAQQLHHEASKLSGRLTQHNRYPHRLRALTLGGCCWTRWFLGLFIFMRVKIYSRYLVKRGHQKLLGDRTNKWQGKGASWRNGLFYTQSLIYSNGSINVDCHQLPLKTISALYKYLQLFLIHWAALFTVPNTWEGSLFINWLLFSMSSYFVYHLAYFLM